MLPKESLKRLERLFRFLIITLFILGVVFWLRSDFWQIKKISCQVNGDPCSADLWAELMNETLGRNIFFLSSGKLSEKIKKNHPEFFQVKISKQFPQNLLFEIKVRKAVVAIGKEGGDFYLADKEGVLLEKINQPANWPLVLLGEAMSQKVGEKIQDEMILKEIKILNESKLRLLEPKSAQATSEKTIEVWFKDDLQVLFSGQKEIGEQLDSLQFIYERTKIEGEKPSKIDLRFDKPVIQ